MNKTIILIPGLIPLIFLIGCQDTINSKDATDNSLKLIEVNSIFENEIDIEKFLQFYNSIKGLDTYNFRYQSAERKKFKRFPGIRKGVQIIDLTKQQRIQLQDILNDILSSQGYLKLLGIISNEDASARVEEELGREKYWVTFFGKPERQNKWGFRFEGHHASLNFSFFGNQLLSSTPFIIGAAPSVMQDERSSPFIKSDEYREGYNILFEEEDIALELINHLSGENYKKGFVQLESGIDLVCEDNEILDLSTLYKIAKIEHGISFSDLDKSEKIKFTNLVNVYFSNFRFQKINEKYLTDTKTKFLFNRLVLL